MQNFHIKEDDKYFDYKLLADPIKRSLQKINRNNPLPLYQQLYDSLYKVIVNKELEPGSFFATESLLQEETQMSRATIRKALEELVRQKYLMRITGKGTFISISYPESHIVLPNLKSLSQELEEKGMIPDSTLLQAKIIQPTEGVAKNLDIDMNDQVLFIERIRTGNDIPILYVCGYIPLNIGITEDFNIPGSLYFFIEQQCGKVIRSATHTINATIINAEVAGHLGISKNSAGLSMERITYDNYGVPVLYETGVFRNDLYSYTFSMERDD
ncbi:GntR family transcriptional regulator [Oceanobacillus sp. FSL K6-0251]|uniref:GntR family transcriptional regulator n=1 Tax=Oceanobacillus sp. FSL K6-0251 TaxID=2921602 RepID=UPI0030F6CB27